MDVKRLCEGIGLHEQARRIVDRFELDDDACDAYKRLLAQDRSAFFERVKQASEYRKLFLYLFVRFAADAYAEYRIRGIGDDVYFDTFRDIQIWCMNCVRDYGEFGIEEYGWLQEHVQLRLFRLGRLQFQPIVFGRELEVGGTKIDRERLVLNVHIPEGEPLDDGLAAVSFARARAFFRGIDPIFVCHSWLLFPQLDEVLPPDSNIMRFQKRFAVVEVDPDDRQAEQRIFHKVLENPAAYAEDTSLRRKAKAYLLAGRKLGSGYGIRIGV